MSIFELRYIGQPLLIGRFSMELAVEQVLGNMLWSGTRILLFLPTDYRLDPCELHEPLNPFVVNRFACLSTELDSVPSVAVDAAYLLMKDRHVLRQLLVFLFLRAGFVVYPLVITGALNPYNLTQPLHAKPLFFMYRLDGQIHMSLSMPAQTRPLCISFHFFRNAFSALRRSFSYSSFFISKYRLFLTRISNPSIPYNSY